MAFLRYIGYYWLNFFRYVAIVSGFIALFWIAVILRGAGGALLVLGGIIVFALAYWKRKGAKVYFLKDRHGRTTKNPLIWYVFILSVIILGFIGFQLVGGLIWLLRNG